jgi:hypothetical protein
VLLCVFIALSLIENELPSINICLSPRPQLRCRLPPEYIYGAFGLFYVDIRLENSTAGCWSYKYGGNL